jgi:hypothetical protein
MDNFTEETAILEIARKAKNGNKFVNLYDKGDISAYNYDENAADLALCNILAFYCGGNFNEIDTLFRQSALYRDKWEDKSYRTNTINKAINLCGGNFYTPRGRPKSIIKKSDELTIDSVANYLKSIGVTIKYNVINRKIDIHGLDGKYNKEHTADILPIILYDELKLIYKKCTKGDIQDALVVIAGNNRYNPVLDILNSAKWDKIDRVPNLYNILYINENDSLSKALIYKWFWQCLSMARNELENAYGADGMLVLQGEQGIGKTTFVRTIALKDEFCGIGRSLNFQDKDTLRRCGSAWIVELGEIETTFKSDKEKLKAFITDETDLYRLPYARNDTHLARRTSFIGTCNSDEYLIDETGNRRFWTIPLEKINLEALSNFNVLQLWIQIDEHTRDNRQGFRLTPEEREALTERNIKHEKPLKSELEIRDIISTSEHNGVAFEYMTATDFKQRFDAVLRNYSVNQIGAALKKIGRPTEQKSINGITRKLALLPSSQIITSKMLLGND